MAVGVIGVGIEGHRGWVCFGVGSVVVDQNEWVGVVVVDSVGRAADVFVAMYFHARTDLSEMIEMKNEHVVGGES
jgi:hypothetical protein